MTDAQLIELLEQKPPSELTESEIAELRLRVPHSVPLQQAVAAAIELDQSLAELLGELRISMDSILNRASAARSRPRWVWLIGGGTLALIGLVLLLVWQMRRPPDEMAIDPDDPTSVARLEEKTRQEMARVAMHGRGWKPGQAAEFRVAGASGEAGEPAAGADSVAETTVPGGVAVTETRTATGAEPGANPAATVVASSGDAPTSSATSAADAAMLKALERADPAAAEAYKAKLKALEAAEKLAAEKVAAAEKKAAADKAAVGKEMAAKNMPPTGTSVSAAAKTTAAVQAPNWNDWPELSDTAPVLETGNFRLEPAGISKLQLQRLVEAVPGQNHQLHEGIRGEASVAGFDGLVRLKAPWRDDLVLRIAPFDHHLAIYFWTGDQGLALMHTPSSRLEWSLYRCTRKAGEFKPSSFQLLGTDNGLYERLNRGPIDLRFQNGEFAVNRGPVRLLTAPLATLPVQVFFDRRGWFRSLRLFRGKELPEQTTPEYRPILAAQKLGELTWTPKLVDGAFWYPDLNGPVELKAEKTQKFARVDLALPTSLGPCEILLEVDSPSPGTGVSLGPEQGDPTVQLGFFEEQSRKATVYGYLRPGEQHLVTNADLNQMPVGYVAPRHWFRLIAGCGTLKIWSSPDGKHWSRLFEPLRGVKGPFTRLGLYCVPGEKTRSIQLRQLIVRELQPLTGLVTAAQLQRVPSELVSPDGDYALWLVKVMAAQPKEISAAEWLRAAAIRVLSTCPASQFGNEVLQGLLEETVARQLPLDQTLAALRAAIDVQDSWEHHWAHRIVQQYVDVGRNIERAGLPAPYSSVAMALLTAPVWSEARTQVMPDRLVRAELISLAFGDSWDMLARVLEQLRFFCESSHPDLRWPDDRVSLRTLVAWSQAASNRMQGNGTREANGGLPIAGQSQFPVVQYRHPLVMELSKEGFNTLAEVHVALAEQSFGDACQIITSARPDLALGLLPDSADPQLFLSLPQAVATAMTDYPKLRSTMLNEYGRLGRLRVQQAVQEGSPQAVHAATVQFYGTPAATEAQVWLGDRALAIGDFPQACRNYERALLAAEGPLRETLAARVRLANAYLGRDAGWVTENPVALGEMTLAAADFEKLVQELKAKGGAGQALKLSAEAEKGLIEPLPAPRVYDVQSRGRWQGDLGAGAGNPQNGEIDWVARQLATVRVNNLLYVSNRFQIAAYDLTNGQQKWIIGLGGEVGHAHRFPLVAMRPTVAGDLLFARRLTKDGPQLIALESQTGKLVWSVPAAQLGVLCDPLWTQGQLLVFASAASQEGLQQVSLNSIDPSNGNLLSSTPVLRIHDVWDRQIPCAAAVAGQRIVATLGGSVICCETGGQPLWVRRQTMLPLTHDSSFYELANLPPVCAGDLMYVTQPGVRAIEAIQIASGRRKWVRGIPDARRMLGLFGNGLILETSDGLMCLDGQTGDPFWKQSIEGLLDASLLPQQGDLLISRRQQTLQDTQRPVLCWIDPLTGLEKATAPLPTLTDRQPMLGPVVQHGDRLWTFFAKGQREPTRELLELIPQDGPTQPGRPVPSSLAAWWPATRIDHRLRWGVEAVLPGWTCLQSLYDARSGYRAEHAGQKDLVGLLCRKAQPVVLSRDLTLPLDRPTHLRMQVGLEGQEKWRVRVRIADRIVADQLIDATTTFNNWKELVVPLSPVELGHLAEPGAKALTLAVIVEAVPESADAAITLWKRLSIGD